MEDSLHDRLNATLASVDAAPRSRADQIHRELRRQLLLGGFPYGERLIEEQLAARFDTSRTPIREALRRLEGDGHVVRDPSGGMRPNPPRVSAMHDLYEVRTVIEELVVRTAAARGPSAAHDELQREWDDLAADWPVLQAELDGPDFVYVDEGFHEALARLSGNSAAERFLRDINEHIRVLRIHDFTTTDRVVETIAEHREILTAVRAGRADAAAALMRVHVERSAAVVERRVGDLLSRMFEGAAP